MGIDLFSESARAYEKDNPSDRVIILDKYIIDRFFKYCKKEDIDFNLNKFLDINLDLIGF